MSRRAPGIASHTPAPRLANPASDHPSALIATGQKRDNDGGAQRRMRLPHVVSRKPVRMQLTVGLLLLSGFAGSRPLASSSPRRGPPFSPPQPYVPSRTNRTNQVNRARKMESYLGWDGPWQGPLNRQQEKDNSLRLVVSPLTLTPPLTPPTLPTAQTVVGNGGRQEDHDSDCSEYPRIISRVTGVRREEGPFQVDLYTLAMRRPALDIMYDGVRPQSARLVLGLGSQAVRAGFLGTNSNSYLDFLVNCNWTGQRGPIQQGVSSNPLAAFHRYSSAGHYQIEPALTAVVIVSQPVPIPLIGSCCFTWEK
ncbi:hypothetical protein B0J13DRAFT_635890 [Dactylonectria estremocensis]|uniref:Uncharacterized protein n=1 Tax=Dactylonectria estremocensis TaxID=1079267 RepID=A0A9P9EVC2_9HYPO|nr:hypothetical protein B0J13DRAFT_635890 [Dactylonectria estremocensis]